MDSTEINKIVGGLIAAFLVFLLLGFAAGKIYGTRAVHGDHHPVLAFALEVEDHGGGEPEEEVTIDVAIASADPAAGKKVFNQCRSCHKVEDGKNGIGPHLWGIVGRAKASVEGFEYSDTLEEMSGEWGLAELDGFLLSPKKYAPGTSMGFGGLKDVQDRADLIAYLNEADGTPVEFAAAAPAVVPAATTEGETAAAPAEGETAAAPTEGESGGEQAAGQEEVQVAAAATGPDYSTGDAAAGKKAFRGCAACHKVEDGKNGVGPHLWGVIGRDIASVEGFTYSDALMEKEGVWTAEALSAFIENPKKWAKGTKMAYPGLKKEKARIDLITYLNEADGSPEPLN